MFNDDCYLNDADIEMNELNREADRISEIEKTHCTHGWRQGSPSGGSVKCLNCGKIFKSWDEIEEESRERRI